MISRIASPAAGQKQKRGGFTLLELLVVVAILAIVAGTLIASYDGLEEKSAQGVATFDIGALNGAIRTYRATNAGRYPDNWDSLMFSQAGDGTDAQPLNILHDNLRVSKLGPYTLTAEAVAALNEAGITTARYVSGSEGYNNALPADGGTQPQIPNRVFDNPPRGAAVPVPLAAGTTVAAVENILQADFGGDTPTISDRLQDMGGLDATRGHVVVAFGVGNNSTLVFGQDGVIDSRTGKLAEAPYYKNVAPTQYGRYVALFHLASDEDGNGGIESGEYFSKARFLAVIDTKGDWYDEELAEYDGVKD